MANQARTDAKRFRKEGKHIVMLHRYDFSNSIETDPDTGEILENNVFNNILEMAGIKEEDASKIKTFKLTFTKVSHTSQK